MFYNPIRNNNDLSSRMGLKALTLKDEYNTNDDDIIRDLYSPCLNLSNQYDRAVGYFRANIYRELGEELLDFVIKGGKVRIVCSPDMPESDELAARNGYDSRGTRDSSYIDADLLNVFKIMSNNPDEVDCLNMLRLLIEKQSLELYIAIRPGGIYHRKVGSFRDEFGNIVVFSGSGNETQKAITNIEDWSNDESFDVYRSWGSEFEAKKAENKDTYLKKLISGESGYNKVRPINEIERDVLAQYRKYSDFESCRTGARARSSLKSKNCVTKNTGIKPYYYQELAIKNWEAANRIGMLCMATGTGKTITALFAIKDLVQKGIPTLILVPSAVLIDQWLKSIKDFFPHIPVLCAGGGHNWKSISGKRIFIQESTLPKIILATMDTAVTNDFLEFFSQAKNPIIVVDEAHRLGSMSHREIMKLKFSAILGLSATPERLFDIDGSSALSNFFGKEPVYTLSIGDKVKLSIDDKREVPILGNFLCKYTYNYVPIHLNNIEQKYWDSITLEIKREVARHPECTLNSNSDLNHLKLLLIKRANIVKGAAEKIQIANDIISQEYSENQRWIVYCQDEKQLLSVFKLLRKNNPNLNIVQYHSGMSQAERERTLNYFEKIPGIIVSIRCLDEGIDIPAADGALILASSTNPREYIQRRGRVLRKSKDKKIAKIIDVLVLPNNSEDDKSVPISIVRSELARAYEFSKLADNLNVQHKLWELCMKYNVDLQGDYEVGLEDN